MASNPTLESQLPGVMESGLITNKSVDFTGSPSVALPTATTINGTPIASIASVTSSATTGALFSVTGTGVYTGVGAEQLIANAATTGVVSLVQANGLTSGTAISVTSSSADTTARSLVKITSSSAAATGAVGLEVANTSTGAALKTTTGLTSTHFQKVGVFGGVTLWVSDGTTANSALTGTAGDLCLNAGSNKPEYCTGTTAWTALV